MSEAADRDVRRSLEWDDGVASERTVLAWERTAISSVAVAVLVVRAGAVEGLLGLAIPVGVMLLVASLAEWIFSRRVYSDHDRPYRHGAVLHVNAFVAVEVVTLIAAAASVALTIGG